MPEQFKRHRSYVNEGTLDPNKDVYLYIQDDPDHGLEEPAGSGYVINDGPGTLGIKTSDDGGGYTRQITVNIGEMVEWECGDDELIHTVYLIADSYGASYRCRFVRSKQVWVV